MNKYLILPSSGDINRGDQALVWETKKVAERAGFKGEYYILSNDLDNIKQTQKEGFKPFSPILRHPSRKFNIKNNTKYNFKLIFTWGIVALFDFVYTLLLLFKPTRNLLQYFSSDKRNKTLELFEDVDAVFVKGGGFIHSYGSITDLYTVYYQLFHIILAQKLGKKVFVMPNSFGPFKAPGVKSLVRYTLNKCELVTARETISQKSLKEISVSSELFPDIAFGLEKSEVMPNPIDTIKEKYPGYRFVTLTARPYRFPSSENPKEDYKKYIESFVKLSKWLYDNKFIPIFVEQTLSETVNESDISAIENICSHLKEAHYEIISDKNFTSRDLKEIYSQADFTIGTRFHSVIFSLSENVPSLAITYGGNKGQGIMKDLGLSDYAIEMSSLEFNDLVNKFKLLITQEEEVRKELPNKNDSIQTKLFDLSMEINEIFNKK